MTNGLISPKPAQGPPGPPPEAARGAPPPSEAFAGILDDAQQARTATAEGQSPDKPTTGDDCAKQPQAQDDATKPADGNAKVADPATAAAASAIAAVPVPVPVPVIAQSAPATPAAGTSVAGQAAAT